MKRTLAYFFSGALFGLGLELGGMTSTAKVRGFLDLFGDFDPQLMLVMGGALAVAIPGEAWLRQRSEAHGRALSEPARGTVDAPLVLGAALFGVGWGLVGLCPGPAVVLLGSLRLEPALFGLAMVLGMALAEPLRRRARQEATCESASDHTPA